MGDALAPQPDASSEGDSEGGSTTPVAVGDAAEAETAWEASTQGGGADATDGAHATDGADATDGAEGSLFTCGDWQCEPPTFMPAGGAVADGTTVRIIAALGFPSSGVFFYTTDGTLPTHASTTYAGGIVVHTAETIRAIAFAQCVCIDSALASATYTIAASDGSPE